MKEYFKKNPGQKGHVDVTSYHTDPCKQMEFDRVEYNGGRMEMPQLAEG